MLLIGDKEEVEFPMKRYCIACQKIFGCLKGGEKHDCTSCDTTIHCIRRNDHPGPQVTGGICKDCWENRQLMKMALKIRYICEHLNLKPSLVGIIALSRSEP